eukprot:TRINITY_DN2451_c3_g1_i1.p1 TRINITY_DN2451_c3_g1~~TRINITY_DN2451_c3_g1_i1.p1  ORF type:complete len:900 (-),score=115.71 TRINITY_DN2451_c3_g1_i1:76-2727(-)
MGHERKRSRTAVVLVPLLAFVVVVVVCFSVWMSPVSAIPWTRVAQLWPCEDGNAYQSFTIGTNPAGPTLKNKQNGRCLQAMDNKPGAALQWHACIPAPSNNNPANQQAWTLPSTSTPTPASIRSVWNSNLCLLPAKTFGTFLGGAFVLSTCSAATNVFSWKGNQLVVSTPAGYCLDSGSYYRCDDPKSPIRNYPFCNTSLPMLERTADLVNRLSTEQLISQMGNDAPAVAQWGIPAYQWWTEGCHGVGSWCGTNCPTQYPAPCTLAASFNMTMVHTMAEAISDEGRALHYEGQSGLDYWAPVINIARDPRWGRNQEVPGEDVYVQQQYAVHYVRGMQEGIDPRYAKVVATCKHYAAYSLENWHGMDRFHFNAIVSDYDLAETYLPAFHACVDARPRSIMCSYNEVNGVPSCANSFLLQTVLRESFGFDGYVVSDCGAIDFIMSTHKYTNSIANTSAVAMLAGTDLNCGQFYQQHLGESLSAGLLKVADIRKSAIRNFKQRFELGMFDPLSNQPYAQIPPSAVNSPKHQALSRQAAQESMVLLKNDGNVLPLPKTGRSIAVIGPNSNATESMLGSYYGISCHDGTYQCLYSPYLGIKAASRSAVTWALGCEILGNDTSGFPAAIEAARNSDVIVFVAGINQTVEAEGHDRDQITLPGMQNDLLKQLQTLKKPLIVVLMNGGAVAVQWIKDNANAIISMSYPGDHGGLALADVLFGDYNPGGKLPITYVPSDYVNQISLEDMNMRASATSPGRTYRYYTGPTIWEFGYGLSYTTFETKWVTVPEPKVFDSLSFRVTVTNTGKLAGDEVVLAFVSQNDPNQGPLKQLFFFKRVHLTPGQSTEVFVSNAPVTPNSARLLRPGAYNIEVGVGPNKLTSPVSISGFVRV